ncbi:MAG: putative enoyl-CoA hydratase/isomerase [Acidimicrobiales bacterium]|nr:putative enoyl-CoA hydratase/isomerase [Acidimicrobiales bacterium]
MWDDLGGVVVGDEPAPEVDVVVPDGHSVDRVAGAVAANPLAARTLAGLLRATEILPVREGLVVESLAYSMLLAGPEFRRWLDARGPRTPPPTGDEPVLLERDGDELVITLNRPDRHNAYAAAVRDALVDALEVGLADPSLRVTLRGAGRSFSSGGDLDEFGTTPDVAAAHLIRTTRSAGRLLDALGDRLTVEVHGACVGAGTELAAFASRVVARDFAFFRLPEVAMGLVPGAGGTVSVTKRIGRHRTAWLALTGARIDVTTALAWGLVDERC